MPRTRLKVVPPPFPQPDAPPEGTWEPWEGGRKRTVNGRTSWYIRRRLGGERVDLALGPTIKTHAQASAELALFDSNPVDYTSPKARTAERLRERSATGDGVRLNGATLEAFLAFAEGRVSENHRRGTLRAYLEQWALELKGRDLRQVRLDDLQEILDGWDTARHKRIVALKAFTKWARTEKRGGKLQRKEDPTADLLTPKIEPEKRKREKGYTRALVQRLYRDLPNQAARDMVRVRVCAHGLHDTELARLTRGDGEIYAINDPGGIAGVLVFAHLKKGEDHAVPVDAETLAAALRLHARGGSLGRTTLRGHIHAVVIGWHGCKGVTRKWTRSDRPGQITERTFACSKCQRIAPGEFRHSFGTWAKTDGEEVEVQNQKGVALEKVAEAMGHLNKRTTKRFYLGDHVPTMVRIRGFKLEHPDDP